MGNIIKNAAIAAILATSVNTSFADEVASMHSAKIESVAFEVGNVLDGINKDSNNIIHNELLFVDAENREYINATDLYDKPRSILGIYKEEVGLPERLEISIDDDAKSRFEQMFTSDLNDHLTRDDVKRFAVLKEITKQFNLTYKTGEEIQKSAGGYENLDSRGKAFIYQNETEVNCATLVLFDRAYKHIDKVDRILKLNQLIDLLSTSKNEHQSSREALKDTMLNVAIDNSHKSDKKKELTELNVRDLTRAVAKEFNEEGKKFLASLESAEENNDDELIAGLSLNR